MILRAEQEKETNARLEAEWLQSERAKQPILQLISNASEAVRKQESQQQEQLPWHEELSDS